MTHHLPHTPHKNEPRTSKNIGVLRKGRILHAENYNNQPAPACPSNAVAENLEHSVSNAGPIPPGPSYPTTKPPQKKLPFLSHFKTDKEFLDLLMLSKKSFTALYALMAVTHRVFENHGIQYWADGGTALGAIRHGGIIPVDDDLDICLWEKDYNTIMDSNSPVRKELQSYGIDLTNFTSSTFVHLKKFAWTKSIPGAENVFCDLFFMTQQNGRTQHCQGKAFHHYFYNSEETKKFKTQAFGPLNIPVIDKAESYLDRTYRSWADKMILTHSHLPRSNDPRLQEVQWPVEFDNPGRFPAAPWDQDLFDTLTRPPV